jgi:hypothetical protein
MMLELTAEGNLRTSTLRAFDHDQMQAIIRRTKVWFQSLPQGEMAVVYWEGDDPRKALVGVRAF